MDCAGPAVCEKDSELQERVVEALVKRTIESRSTILFVLSWCESAMMASRFNMFQETDKCRRQILLAINVSAEELPFSLECHQFPPFEYPDPAHTQYALSHVRLLLTEQEFFDLFMQWVDSGPQP